MEVTMPTVAPAFIPAVVAARQRATVRKFRAANADEAARARTLDDLGVRNDHLFRRLVKAGVVTAVDDGHYFLNADGLAGWERRRRILLLIAAVVLLIGTAIALGLSP